jgi:hypothetical protein
MASRWILAAGLIALMPPAAGAQLTVGLTSKSPGFVTDSVRPRPRVKAIEYSDWYYRRLLIHRYGSYVMLPLFATQYYLGDRLMGDDDGSKDAHVAVGTTIGALFVVNTVTGAWNLWDSRSDPEGRRKRIVHSLLMMTADAGFAVAAGGADDDGDEAETHKAIALSSMGVSVAGAALMWFWR